MPTRKQRRRQEKSRRHEWEYVYVDEEGREVDVDPAELKAPKAEKHAAARNGKPSAKGRQQPARRQARVIEPPSWARVRKRALVIGPVVVIAMLLLNRHQPLGQRILPAVVLLVFFLPMSYVTDSFAYRMYRKRVDRNQQARPTKQS